MQTFLPYPDIFESVRCLDYRRLGKQRVEAMQILKALRNPKYGWQNHPAVKMWRGHEKALAFYMNACIDEWIGRGYNNNMIKEDVSGLDLDLPPWFGNESFHASHRSNLIRKDAEHYLRYGWIEPADMEYVWPTVEGE